MAAAVISAAPAIFTVGGAAMTPKEYLDRYTYLKFFSPFNFMQVEAAISNYGSGWKKRYGTCRQGGDIQQEYQKFTAAVRMKHHGNRNTPCAHTFYFNELPTYSLITPFEDFWIVNLINAFNGKGSPDEITDVLRLAMLVGRIGTDKDAAGQPPAAPSAQIYATQFMTLDCNALVGNYYGVNSSSHISKYASAGVKRTSVATVRPGDVVVTHCDLIPYEHIGLIQEWTPNGDKAASMRLVEWGWFGGESVHYSAVGSHTIQQGPNKQFGIGWSATHTNSDTGVTTPTFKYVFAPPIDAATPSGWP